VAELAMLGFLRFSDTEIRRDDDLGTVRWEGHGLSGRKPAV